MKNLRLLLLLFLFFAFTAVAVETKYPLDGNGYPVWISNSFYDGYMGGVGYAEPQDKGGFPAQRRVAIANAQADLAKFINVFVDVKTNREVFVTQHSLSKRYETLSKQNAHEFIRGSKVMDEWLDKKTGKLYIWVVIS